MRANSKISSVTTTKLGRFKDTASLVEDHVLRCIGWILHQDVEYLCDGSTLNSFAKLKKKIKFLSKTYAILDVMHELDLKKRSATQRELYYRLLDEFKSQREVNQTILLTGTIAGLIEFRVPGLSIDISKGEAGVLISEQLLSASEIHSSASYIIIVEKDTIFRTLCSQKIWNVLPCILITGKGFPDFLTKRTAKTLEEKLGLQIGYVGDFDPHGILIYLNYCSGDGNMEAQTSNCKSMRWIGPHSEDYFDLNSEVLLELTNKDKSTLVGLLRHPVVNGNKKLYTQCEDMQAIGKKFEVEALFRHGRNYLSRYYIPKKILRRQWI